MKIQNEKPDKTNFVSVVVLDEVGLAEDSPNLPLKVLHPLLEDGTEGNSYSVEVSSCHAVFVTKLVCNLRPLYYINVNTKTSYSK